MLLLLKIFVPVIVLFAGKQPGMPKENSGLLVTVCIPDRSADSSKWAGFSSGSAGFFARLAVTQ
jgi:hypothetical protein